MRDLLFIAAASFVTIWDVTANQMTIVRTIVRGATVVALFFQG